MKRIIGKVTVKETGAGIGDLIIVTYLSDPDTLPKEILSGEAIKIDSDIWQKIKGARLGSIMTDQHGHFEMEYETPEFQEQNNRKHPALFLLVVAPEDPSIGPCPVILHVSCGPRQSPGRVETYLIKLPVQQLRKAGVSMPGMPVFPSDDPDLDNLFSKMKEVANKRQKEQNHDEKPFAERFKEQHEQLAKEQKKAGVKDIPPLSFEFVTAASMKSDENVLPMAQIVLDEESKQILFKSSPEAEPFPLNFEGVRYVESARDAGDVPSIIINEHENTFNIRIPSSPTHLHLPETSPSALFNFDFVGRQRNHSAGEVPKQPQRESTSQSEVGSSGNSDVA